MSRFLLSEERLYLISASKNFKSIKIDQLTYSKKSEPNLLSQPFGPSTLLLILDYISVVFAHFPEESLIEVQP